jgi:hypothetical protein
LKRNAKRNRHEQPNHNDSEIDHRTCRSICDAIGERLQQRLRPDTSRLSSHLKHLMDELRKRDSVGPLEVIELTEFPFGIGGLRKRYFAHNLVAFGGGSGDNAACFQSPTYRSGLPDDF